MTILLDYTLAAIAVLFVAGLACFYGQISERKRQVGIACIRLDNRIQAQVKIIKQLYSTARDVPNIHAVHALLRQHQAIRSLGMHAIDQRSDIYDKLHDEIQLLRNEQTQSPTPEYQQEAQAFEENHLHLQEARTVYNQAALKYNDCQRNAVQDWFSSLLGHQMVPPC